MSSMTFASATPDDLKQASEKALNFWVGAMSPMWLPFVAASSLGLGAWALTRSLATMPGYGASWLRSDFLPQSADEAMDAPARIVKQAETTLEQAEMTLEKAEEPLLDPVAEVPVVPAVVEAAAEPVVAKPIAAKAVAPKVIAPKSIANELAVSKAKAAAKAKK